MGRAHVLIGSSVLTVTALVAFALWYELRPGRDRPPPEATAPVAPPQFAGTATCSGCHAAQAADWRRSHHSHAMQPANDTTVLGDFDGAEFTQAGVTSTFFKRDGRYYVTTEGPDGAMRDFEITHTFGLTPLQQYLIPFPDGRLQALSIAWDARSRDRGGQRWFHLYPDERIAHDDELHWTGLQQNWNFMCADCHSTNLDKNYDAAADEYRTSWTEIDVACEACHGPGSRHVAQARRGSYAAGGLTVALTERKGVRWEFTAAGTTARRSEPRNSEHEIEVCAQCHSRRSQVAAGYEAGRSFLDHYRPALLEAPLYFADGQQREEVYTWGSFRQSRMYASGVTCSDCHDPHSGELRASGNAVCAQCHRADTYDVPAHHHHTRDSVGAQCTACHMPATTYMIVDPRHDHGLRIPRPDLTVALGTPNACNGCHRDQSPRWAARRIGQWFADPHEAFQRFGPALDAASRRAPGASQQLAAVVADTAQPDIVRASATAALAHTPSQESLDAMRAALADRSALVRLSALAMLDWLPPESRIPFAAPLLEDPVRMVRIDAASVLASVPATALDPVQRGAWERAAREYEDAQRSNADRPEARTNLCGFRERRARYAEAEAECRAAIALQAAYAPAWVNLADLMRAQGRDADAESTLRAGLAAAPGDASIRHALGLTLVRLQRAAEALPMLESAARLAPDNARFAYVYAIALNSTGNARGAIGVLRRALERLPYDHELLLAAATIHRDAGEPARALDYAERLLETSPTDPATQRLVAELRTAARVSPD